MANGLEVFGSQIHVDISAKDGSLHALYANHPRLENLPQPSKAVAKEQAQKDFIDNLQARLMYVNDYRSENNQFYSLVYQAAFAKAYQYYDAVEGKWKSNRSESGNVGTVSHPWAQDELNYLIQGGNLQVDNMDQFNPDVPITKGEALEVIMKSLMRFYPYDHYGYEQNNRLENIDKSHKLYEIVNRALELGILDSNMKTFDYEAKLTREELAVWYVRALGLEKAAKHPEIYQLSFRDANLVSIENRGYVALANALGILQGSNNQFKPREEVTMAQLAVSVHRMARHAGEPRFR